MNKSFKGRIANAGTETIRLSTNNGLIGYKIIKFQLMPVTPHNTPYENIVQVFTIKPDSASSTMDFTNPTLLAAGYTTGSSSTSNSEDMLTIFDTMKFNQDIFITNSAPDTATEINYYLELEQVKLSVDEAAVATLKDMRGRE
tara:strand:- start:9 stop:437 length:429 start_codon:yes stop_codon:yes gene_type:complete